MSNYMINAVKLNANTNLEFYGRMWLPGIIDSKHKRIAIFTSRQVGKSSNIASTGLCKISKSPGYRILYVSPEHEHAKKYSQDKLNPILKSSPYISRCIDKSGSNNLFEKSFEKDGRYYIKYAKHNPDSCRGLTVDEVDYDEIQDMDLDEIGPVIEESLFTSKFKRRIWAGTPKSFSNSAHKLYLTTNRSEWLVKCVGCNAYNNLGIRNIGLKGPVCFKCGKGLDTDLGVWVAHNPSSDIAGYHVNQMHCKISHADEESWNEILFKLENYPDYRFKNEVLGISADTDEQPITEAMLYHLCDPTMRNTLDTRTSFMSYPMFAGIDWSNGGSFATTISIGTFINGKFKYVYLRKFQDKETEPDFCIPEMANIILAFQCIGVHCDHGAGFALNRSLAKAIKKLGMDETTVTANYWSGNAKARDAAWDMKQKIPTLTLNKASYIADYISDLKNQKMSFCCWEDFHPQYSVDFTNVRQEMVDNVTNQSIRFNRVGPDDIFQSCIYAYIRALMHANSSAF
jgi:hypothetical protein